MTDPDYAALRRNALDATAAHLMRAHDQHAAQQRAKADADRQQREEFRQRFSKDVEGSMTDAS